ncbi:MAG: aspartate-semialdehyde dehydrogenase [Nitrososphaerales archaeon]
MLHVAIIGATGVVGQEFIVSLKRHQWFDVKYLAASERSAGKKYIDAIHDNQSGVTKWHQQEPVPEYARDMVVKQVSDIKPQEVDLVFTAIESDDAKVIEPKFAEHIPVISTAAAFRYDNDVPILIPGINDEQAELINIQRKNRGWKGFIAPLPNCTTTGMAITLKPILDDFGVKKVFMTSMQAVSGAGRTPGVAALDIFDNIVPYIPKEEEKVQRETMKILGTLNNGSIKPADMKVSCTCTRAAVLDGHTEAVFVETEKACEPVEVKQSMLRYSKNVSIKDLPTAPPEYIYVHDDPARPQPRLDRMMNGGMTTLVGRLRKDTALDKGVKYVLLSNNEKMGSAKGAVLLAELLEQRNYL